MILSSSFDISGIFILVFVVFCVVISIGFFYYSYMFLKYGYFYFKEAYEKTYRENYLYKESNESNNN